MKGGKSGSGVSPLERQNASGVAESPVALHVTQRALLRRARESGDSESLPLEPWPIPERWRWARMGDVAEVAGGGTPKTSRPEYFGGDVRWINRQTYRVIHPKPSLVALEILQKLD